METKVTKSLNNHALQEIQKPEQGTKIMYTGTNFQNAVLEKDTTTSASPCCDNIQLCIIVYLLQNIYKKLCARTNANKIRTSARKKFLYRKRKLSQNLDKRRTVSTMTTEDKATQFSSMSDNRGKFDKPPRTSEEMASNEVMKNNTLKAIQEILALFYEDQKKKATDCKSVSARLRKIKLGEKMEKIVTEREIFENRMPYKCRGKFQHIRNTDPVCLFPLYEVSRNFDEYIQNELRSENPFNSSLEARSASNRGNVSPSTPDILSASSQEKPAVEIPHSMNMELIRLASFSNFPSSHLLSSIRLARSGFYYTGENDKVACFACKATYSGWQEGDIPDEVHQRISPNCPLVSGEQNINVPIGNGRDSMQPRRQNTSTNVTELRHQQSQRVQQSIQMSAASTNGATSTSEERATDPVSNYERPSGSGASSASVDSTVFNSAIPTASETYRGSDSARGRQERINEIIRQLDPLGINFDRPKYPEYAVLANRISSFTDWPTSLRQTPRELATAGFLYAGYGDYTRCFFCGGGLRNWESDDDPWVEHARWFPKCAYVRQNKGDDFVALVQIEHKEQESRQAASGASNLDIQASMYSNARCSSTMENGTNSPCTAVDVLSLPSCQGVLEMGYSRDTVRLAFQTLQKTKDADEIHGEDLMDVILTNEERQNNQTGTENNQTPLSNSEISPANGSPESSSHTNAAAEKEADDESMELLSRKFDDTTLEDTRSLIEENRQLKNQRRCKICLEEDASIAMLPCGHLCCCAECAPAMRKCPICRQFVKGTVKTWLV